MRENYVKKYTGTSRYDTRNYDLVINMDDLWSSPYLTAQRASLTYRMPENLGVQLSFDETSYRTMMDALDRAIKGKGRLGLYATCSIHTKT